MNFSAEDIMLLRAQARLIFSLIAIAWIVHIINIGMGGWLNYAFMRRARHPWGLFCIATSPFLHADWDHLTGNTIGFLILGWLIAAQGIHLFYFVTFAVALLGGLMSWLFGRNGVGASGVIFGYMGFLLIYGITVGELFAIVAALIAVTCFGDRIIGGAGKPSLMLPLPGYNIGWQAHLYGFIAGMLTAYLLSALKLSHY